MGEQHDPETPALDASDALPRTAGGTIDSAEELRCIRFLLGELDATETADFNAQLDSSPQLAEMLVHYAELMTSIDLRSTDPPASLPGETRPASPAPARSMPGVASPVPSRQTRLTTRRRRNLIGLASAACLAAVLTYPLLPERKSPVFTATDEALLIALTWAGEPTGSPLDRTTAVTDWDATPPGRTAARWDDDPTERTGRSVPSDDSHVSHFDFRPTQASEPTRAFHTDRDSLIPDWILVAAELVAAEQVPPTPADPSAPGYPGTTSKEPSDG